MKVFYDFHIHSALSPCGDDENTPNNIAGMSSVKGLNAIALCDHNSILNCAATISACQKYGIVCLPGMEITTAEDIHVITLFERISDAEKLYEIVKKRRMNVQNNVRAFGHQLIMDSDDRVTGEEGNLLIVSSGIPIEEIGALCTSFHGVAIPAHIDKQTNSVCSVLGYVPENFSAYEVSAHAGADFFADHAFLKERILLHDSDAHDLGGISEPENFFELDECTPQALLNYLSKRG